MYFTPYSSVSINNFEQVNVGWVELEISVISFSHCELLEELFAEKNFSTTHFDGGIFQNIQSSFKIKILP